MIDFPFTSFSYTVAFVNLLLFLYLSIIGYRAVVDKRYLRHNYIFVSFYAIIIGVVAVTYIIGTDFFHYQEIVAYYKYSNVEYHMESIYFRILDFAHCSYLYFRIIVWGGALLFFIYTLKILKLPILDGLFFFVVCYLSTFSYARASLAMMVCLAGLCTFLHRYRLSSRIFGLTLILLSPIFHRSIIALALCCSIALFKLKRKHIMLILILSPFVALLIDSIISYISAGGDVFVFDEETNDDLLHYQEKNVEEKNWKGVTSALISFSTFYIPIAVIVKNVFLNMDVKINVFYKRLAQVLVMLTIVASSFFFMGYGNYIIFYRVLFMTFPLTLIELTYLWKMKIIKKRTNFIIILLCFISQLLKYYIAIR